MRDVEFFQGREGGKVSYRGEAVGLNGEDFEGGKGKVLL